ncbi:hypothetical protein [Sphingobacterium sp.]|uniref:hypothetical protein n=1 Tax=Sphingobacterium sp. TaxID=341027 RepID=UPI00258D6B6D|nr:hypothetical protein [Sphingobacterium sp.]WET68943.1 MAG: hypothetical protein P0Y57_24180 [Sphingobacterium sp.]
MKIINVKNRKNEFIRFGSFPHSYWSYSTFRAVLGFISYGKINLKVLSGKLYFYATAITSFTALGISKQGGFNAGHVFSLFILVLVTVAYWLHATKKSSTKARYFENFLWSFSFFLSLVPAVNETFTRVPIGHPLAKDINDPIIGQTLLVLFVLFIIVAVFQYFKQKKINTKLGAELKSRVQ